MAFNGYIIACHIGIILRFHLYKKYVKKSLWCQNEWNRGHKDTMFFVYVSYMFVETLQPKGQTHTCKPTIKFTLTVESSNELYSEQNSIAERETEK